MSCLVKNVVPESSMNIKNVLGDNFYGMEDLNESRGDKSAWTLIETVYSFSKVLKAIPIINETVFDDDALFLSLSPAVHFNQFKYLCTIIIMEKNHSRFYKLYVATPSAHLFLSSSRSRSVENQPQFFISLYMRSHYATARKNALMIIEAYEQSLQCLLKSIETMSWRVQHKSKMFHET